MMEAPDPFNSWEELAELILKLQSRIVELEDQMGSVRRTLYGIPKGDAGDRQFTKSKADPPDSIAMSVNEFLHMANEVSAAIRKDDQGEG